MKLNNSHRSTLLDHLHVASAKATRIHVMLIKGKDKLAKDKLAKGELEIEYWMAKSKLEMIQNALIQNQIEY